LVVEMALSGDLLPTLAADGSAIEFATADGVSVLRYGNLHAYDANGQELLARLALAGCQAGQECRVQLRVDDGDAVYPITIDPLATSAAWTAEGDQANAQFSYSVATAGDVNGDGYSDVIIGAPYFDGGQTDEGKVFVYLGSATGLGASGTPRMPIDGRE
jgi:hypothetical protein